MNAENLRIVPESAEAELLVHCARLDIGQARAERICSLLDGRLDWVKVIALAQRNALIPLLYFQLQKTAPEKIPAEQLKELRVRFQSNSALNVLLTGELVSLLDVFEQNQIPAVPYKGPALSVAVYGSLALRQFADLDILVPEKDVWKATELLTERGYRAHFVIPAHKRGAFTRLSYVRLFQRASDGTTVELHWRLAPRFFGSSFDTANLWQRTRKISLQGANVRVPLSLDLILMLCIHGAKDCWERLEWVCGLAELIRSDAGIDWQRLLDRAKEAHSLAIVSLGLRLAHDVMDAPVPAKVITELGWQARPNLLANKIVARFFNLEAAPLSVAQRIKFHLQIKDSLSDKLRYCSLLASTTTPVDWELMSLPESVSFLYYPLRALRLLKKYGRDSNQLTGEPGSVAPVRPQT